MNDENAGLAVANKGLYEYEITENDVSKIYFNSGRYN